MQTIKNSVDKLIPLGNIVMSRSEEGVTLTGPHDSDRAVLPETFPIPLRMDVTAKTDDMNIRLKCGLGQIVLNWEGNRDEMRVHDPVLGVLYGVNEWRGRIKTREFVDITWIVDHDYMLLVVDGETRLFFTDGPYMHLKKQGLTELPTCLVGIGPYMGSVVTVKNFQVTPWNSADHLDQPLALLLDHHQITIQPDEKFTLRGRVFPENIQNQKVFWSTDQDFVNLTDHGDGSVTIQVAEQGTAVIKGYTEDGRLSNVCNVRSVIPNLKTNLQQLNAVSGDWCEEYDGMRGRGSGDIFIVSSERIKNFVYETDVVLEKGRCAALLFRTQPYARGFYCANICTDGDGHMKLWRPGKDIKVVPADIERNQTYHLKVEVREDNIKVYLDGTLMIDVNDSTYNDGYLGLNVFVGKAVFQHLYYQPL